MKWLICLVGLISLNAAAVQCPKTTSKTEEVEALIRTTFGYKSPMRATLSGNVGNVATSLRLIDVKGRLHFHYQRLNIIEGSAVACVKRGEIWITSTSAKFGSQTFILKGGGPDNLRVGMRGMPGSAVLTAR